MLRMTAALAGAAREADAAITKWLLTQGAQELPTTPGRGGGTRSPKIGPTSTDAT